MKLKHISSIYSGYITRKRIEACADGSHFLVQAKDVDSATLSCDNQNLIRFHPALSRTDRLLKNHDLLFMARGAHHFTIELKRPPRPALAAACFFIIRVNSGDIRPGYLGWYLNQAPVAHYLFQNSGRNVHMPVIRRSVLENIDVPLPGMKIQNGIAELNALASQEANLLQTMMKKRLELISSVCLKAIGNP